MPPHIKHSMVQKDMREEMIFPNAVINIKPAKSQNSDTQFNEISNKHQEPITSLELLFIRIIRPLIMKKCQCFHNL